MKLSSWLTILCFTTAALAGPDERVTEIRQWYDTLQKATAVNEKKVPFEAADTPLGGDLISREFNGGWKAVTVSYTGDLAGADQHFYFKDGTLFFAYVVSHRWHFAGESAEGTLNTAGTRHEGRYYYDSDKCIRRLTRSATAEDANQLAAILSKQEQTTIDPGDEAATLLRRAKALRDAASAADILRAFEIN